ncbi:MAG: MFS transporter [Planctomycetes bacterium]|nr:MFS transporter [Planctomycetota bacterium]
MINTRRLFVLSCIALVTSAFTFSLHGDAMQEMGRTFNFTQERNGAIGQAIFYGMAISMLFGGFICDALGMKRIMYLALASHLCGAIGMVSSKQILGGASENAYLWLYISGFLMGCGNGFTEVGINPLVATIYANNKTHFLNILHAWWPGGLVIGGLSAVAMRKLVFGGDVAATNLLLGLEYWQSCLVLIIVPAVIYGAMLLGSTFPATERVASGVSTGEMFGQVFRPMFLLWAFCMLLTAATELGPQKWQNSVMTSKLQTASAGTLILVYTSGMMFVLRHFAGPIAHRLSPVGMLTGSAALSAVGLFMLSYVTDAVEAFFYATVYGLGIAYFWPTMLGVAAERFPKGGALILALMGSAGNASIAFVLPQMGKIVDHYAVQEVTKWEQMTKIDTGLIREDGLALNPKRMEGLSTDSEILKVGREAESVGFSMAFRWVAILPVVLVFIFGGIAFWDKSQGGYQPEVLPPQDPEKAFAGGVEGPIE